MIKFNCRSLFGFLSSRVKVLFLDFFCFSEAIRIKAMFPGQPAMNSEELRIGDIILAANGTSLEGKTNRDAINVLRDQPQRVALTVKRDPESIPPCLLRRGSFSHNLDPGEMLSVIHSRLRKENSRESQLSVYSDTQGEAREPHGSLEGDPREKSHAFSRGSGDEDDAQGNTTVRDDDEPLLRQQFVSEGVASLASSVEDLSSLPPPPDGHGPDNANGDDVIEDSADQENYRRRSSAFSGMVEPVERSLSTNSLRTSSEASVLSPDGNKKETLAPDEEVCLGKVLRCYCPPLLLPSVVVSLRCYYPPLLLPSVIVTLRYCYPPLLLPSVVTLRCYYPPLLVPFVVVTLRCCYPLLLPSVIVTLRCCYFTFFVFLTLGH